MYMDASRIRHQHPDSVAIFVTVAPKASRALRLKKQKFIVHADTRTGAFCFLLRKYIEGVRESTGLFFYTSDRKGTMFMIPMDLSVGELDALYARSHNVNGQSDASWLSRPVLNIQVAGEDVFGAKN
jgi:hypothetical protein